MCIAIVKTKKGIITDEQLKNCWNRNPDGAGFAYPCNNKVVIRKGYFNFDKFLKDYRAVEKTCKSNMLIHFRISTSGNIDTTNCHPHRVNDKMAMIHNGILHIDVPKNSPVSDTVLYCKNYLQKLPKGFTSSDVIMEYIEEHIGSGNKFCFIEADGKYSIVNESAGKWDNGVWYSNESYKQPRITYSNWYKTGAWSKYYNDDWNDPDYGFGSVLKYSDTAWLTRAEQEQLLKSDDLYNEVWDTLDDLDKRSSEDMEAVQEVLALGTDPMLNLLTGKLEEETSAKARGVKENALVPLADYDDTEGGLYSYYLDIYNAACSALGTDV